MEREVPRDEQVEWFHSFAKQPLASIVAQASEANRTALVRFVTRCLPGYSFPQHLSPEEFAEAVHLLRHNEREWNQGLCAALIEADETFHARGGKVAAASLEAFALSCPWSLFAEVARDQAAQYLGS